MPKRKESCLRDPIPIADRSSQPDLALAPAAASDRVVRVIDQPPLIACPALQRFTSSHHEGKGVRENRGRSRGQERGSALP